MHLDIHTCVGKIRLIEDAFHLFIFCQLLFKTVTFTLGVQLYRFQASAITKGGGEKKIRSILSSLSEIWNFLHCFVCVQGQG